MKRLLNIIAFLVILPAMASSQNVFTHFGIEGGVSVNSFSNLKDIPSSGLAGWHAGISLLTKLPGMFALQPTVIYEKSNAMVQKMEGDIDRMAVDAVSVPISVQWGPDLGICRVFLEAVPFIGFNIGGRLDNWEDVKAYLKTTQLGIGTGLGLDVWRFQFNARYNWSFGDWQTITASNPFKDMQGMKRGLMITLAYFFH